MLLQGPCQRRTTLFDYSGLAAAAWSDHQQLFAIEGTAADSVDNFTFGHTPKKMMHKLKDLDVLLVAPPQR